ncbi:HtaA domain-containing protein [Streptomyces sp. 549]|uniref:HtaA domain-containing protein n=1 Tax=Streptomyces sp. 549 TaxID=3049076 RepID=UPI0024C2445A|nr:HtaA domain-containing protein [Streptomyces sp. 549]MDK1474045.1 HtaA domain-containing protein [Streptomyces sp. 549]
MPSFGLRRPFAAALLAALVAALLPALPAQAAERTVAGGRLDWGVKSSFQTYVTGPIAQGGFSLVGGAGTVGANQFRFHSASGGYDPDSGAFRASFGGGVRFTGHRAADGSQELDLTISRPTVRISGGSGTLYADMRSKARGSGTYTDRAQVPLANLRLGGVDMRGGGSPIALNSVPATLTAEGATAFAGYYAAGTPLDPVSLSVDVRTPAATSAPATPAPSPKKSDAATGSSKSPSDGSAAVHSAALDWGVRRTFREHVSSDLVSGEWKTADGAKDGGALFRFPLLKGTWNADGKELSADLRGSVTFTGKDLDLTLEELSVKVKGGKGTLSAGGRSLAVFDAPLKPSGGLLAVTEAPAELTKQGAAFFDGLYPAGTAMDPVSLAVALDGKATLPPLPDLGSDPTEAAPSPSSSPSPAVTAADDVEPAASTSASAALPISLAAASLAVMAAAFWFVRRRRTAPLTADNSEESQPR